MKRTLNIIALLVLITTSAFGFDPPQRVYSVVIEKELLHKVDKIYILKDCSTDSQLVDVNTDSYIFPLEPKSRVKIKLKNQNQFYPNSIIITENTDKIHICTESNNITFKVEKYVDFKANALLLFSIYLLLIIKLVITILIIKPLSKFGFIKKYGLIYLAFILLLLVTSFSQPSLLFTIGAFTGMLLFLIFDFAFLLYKHKKKGVIAFIISSIIISFLGIILFNMDL